MLGLDPWPPRSPLQAQITGRIVREHFVVEKLHFQSLPGLYVTANLYLPRVATDPLPGVLYLCGRSRQVRKGVSFGNKTGYHHHGVWFARHGYVCLLIDTLQLGEIQGIHDGTYRHGRWWWNSRGYTPAGVETWNAIRALDYLQSRSEVDPQRLGVTGRSGGGAYSWFLAALDPRVRVAAPVAGITDLRNHVLDGTIEGHCDCMFFVNLHRWDYPMLAALVAPRPLLLANSDQDRIFPLDGVLRTYQYLRRLYASKGALDRLGLVITPGPHQDTQSLRIPVFHWFNRWLRGEDPPLVDPAPPVFEPEELKVFEQLPPHERNTTIDETFVPQATLPSGWPEVPDRIAWQARWRRAVSELLERDRTAAPSIGDTTAFQLVGRLADRTVERSSLAVEPTLRLPVLRIQAIPAKQRTAAPRLVVCDPAAWHQLGAWLRQRLVPAIPSTARQLEAFFGPRPDPGAAPTEDPWLKRQLDTPTTLLFLAPRGVGPTAWDGDERTQTHIRRRFMLLGRTIDTLRVGDIRLALHRLGTKLTRTGNPLTLAARGPMAFNALLAVALESQKPELDLENLPQNWKDAPDHLGLAKRVPLEAILELAQPNISWPSKVPLTAP